MKLSGDGASITILPLGREVADRALNGEEPDWLVIALDARTSQGTWSARAACLTSPEARWIGRWLRWTVGARNEIVAPDDRDFTNNLEFQEPLLAFEAVPSVGLGVIHLIRVYMSYWLGPPWVDIDEASNRHAYFVDLPMSAQAIIAAADVWDAELSALH